MGQDTEHQEFAYGSQDAAIDDAHWRKQEASYDKQEANCKINDNVNDNDNFFSDNDKTMWFQRRYLRCLMQIPAQADAGTCVFGGCFILAAMWGT